MLRSSATTRDWRAITNPILRPEAAPSDNFLTFISTETHKVLGKITFDGNDPRGDKILANGIEQCQWNPRDEKFYLAIPDIGGSNGAVLVISTSAPFHVEKVFKIPTTTGCAGPTGLAISPNHQIQFGCGGTNALIIDDRSGIIIKTELTEGGADEGRQTARPQTPCMEITTAHTRPMCPSK